jgi:hypothetical protein
MILSQCLHNAIQFLKSLNQNLRGAQGTVLSLCRLPGVLLFVQKANARINVSQQSTGAFYQINAALIVRTLEVFTV